LIYFFLFIFLYAGKNSIAIPNTLISSKGFVFYGTIKDLMKIESRNYKTIWKSWSDLVLCPLIMTALVIDPFKSKILH